MTAPSEEPSTRIDDLLAEQRQLTAVGQFARAHERHEIRAPRYQQLLPLSAPRPGEQYAFEVDLDKCSGCKACVTACHSLNGLDDGESWRDVGALFGEALVPEARGGNRVEPLQQIVTTACHHCVEPGCLEGCPVLAYDKDPITGIVRHLDDQCIGCGYCILKCPYDVPKYSAKRGIVRKCDLCHGRLDVGEAPACVQACPNEAIRITLVEKEAVRREFRPNRNDECRMTNVEGETIDGSFVIPHSSFVIPPWLPDSPSPARTLPTTRYVTKKPVATLRSAHHERPRPQSPHWPLILMLVLTQAGIGGFMAALFSRPPSSRLAVVSLGWLFAGLTASVFHLGRPGKAWRVWLGWRTSWLSREAIALNLFVVVAALAVVLPRVPAPWILMTAALGVVTVFAQSMVYADTRREFWQLTRTAPRFLGTTLVLGLAFALLSQPATPLALALVGATLLKLGCELAVLKHADSDLDTWTQLRRTAVLQRGVLRPVLAARLLFGLSGGVLLPFLMATGPASLTRAAMAFSLCLIGELAERYLYFASVAPDRMP